ncbi:hypothetical protein SAMN05216570_2464 [Dyella sp. OK004]|uniref:hypothetical protein n=1 Tax=Dyella sp. OK004 TaxID=1855292 RepID=UPI0008E41E9E|nr:hypothetical protein [Dyella sp. OK004]SFS08820.1 hypothetical protein SAMN05216570_2464 [Dyella sp. OK004]
MRNLLALIYYVMTLVGCTGGRTIEMHSIADGHDKVHGVVHLQAGVAKFECLGSASGQCHFALFSAVCPDATADKACDAPPLERLALAVGASREIVGLPVDFKACVDERDDTAASICGKSRR